MRSDFSLNTDINHHVGTPKQNKEHCESLCTIYLDDEIRTTVIWLLGTIKLSIHSVHCCYFDEVNLHVIDVQVLKITTGSYRDYGNKNRVWCWYFEGSLSLQVIDQIYSMSTDVYMYI